MELSLCYLNKPNEALPLLRKSKIIYEECKLYHMVEKCNKAIIIESNRKMNQIFYFCVGLAICFVVWKIKN